MVRPEKAAAVAELTEHFRESSAAVLTEYRGLTVAQLKELRTALAGNATYAVVKNTLSKIAAREAGVEGLDDLLAGPSAIAFVTGDPVEVAKGLRDFAKNNPPLIVKGGVLDGRPLSAEEIGKLADLESREVLLAKLAGGMKASLQQAVSMFAAPLSQMARLAGALEAAATADPSILAGGAGTPAPIQDEAVVAAAATTDEPAPATEETAAAEATAPADTSAEETAPVDTSAEATAPVDAAVEETAPVDTSAEATAPVEESADLAADETPAEAAPVAEATPVTDDATPVAQEAAPADGDAG